MGEPATKVPMQGLEELEKFLVAHTVDDVPIPDKKIAFISEAMNPGEAFQVLVDNGVRAAPVVRDGRPIGTVDLLDACNYLVDISASTAPTASPPVDPSSESAKIGRSPFIPVYPENDRPQPQRPMTEMGRGQAATLLHSHPDWNTPNQIADMAKKRPFSLFPEKTPLIDAALALSRGNHIIGVSTAAEPTKVERIISQAQLITFCQTQFENLKVPVDMLMTSPVLSVKCKDKTVKAFKIMATKRISAMSVVDESGEVQHNVSTSDIKSFFTPPFENPHSALQEPIEDFLIRLRARGAASKTRIPVSTCLKGEELSSVVAKLNRAKYHHAWVVGTDRKPVGVLSLTDVFSHIYGKSGRSKSRSGFCSVQ